MLWVTSDNIASQANCSQARDNFCQTDSDSCIRDVQENVYTRPSCATLATAVDGMPLVKCQPCTSPVAVGHSSETGLPLGCSLAMEVGLLICLDVSCLDVTPC